MSNKCKTCGKNCDGEYCFMHKPRKPLASSRGFKTIANKYEDEIHKTVIMQTFFLQIWKKRLHYSEVSEEYLGDKPLSVFFHHILPKNKYPEAELDEENIILLTLNEHDQVESDMYRFEEVNKRREQLKKKYDI
jgi:hypothetical protein